MFVCLFLLILDLHDYACVCIHSVVNNIINTKFLLEYSDLCLLLIGNDISVNSLRSLLLPFTVGLCYLPHWRFFFIYLFILVGVIRQ